MKNRLRRGAIRACYLMLTLTVTIRAQEDDGFIRLDRYDGRKVPKSLLTLVSIDLDEVPLEQALTVIADEGNLKLSYNRNRIPVHKKISVNMDNVYALEVLIKILEATRTELMITQEGQLVIVPSKQEKKRKGMIRGRVLDRETKKSLRGTNIYIVGTSMGGTSDTQGHFEIRNIPTGIHTLQFSYIGYEIERIENITVSGNDVIDLSVELMPQPILLKEITVTPGQFSILGKGPNIRQTLTHEDLQTVTFGEDVYRAITRLPGISASDFSAKFTVRGGDNEEVLVLMDGLELYEPFHLKDIEGGVLSIVDVEAIENIDLFTGGFSVEYGNRMSGVFNIHTTKVPEGKRRTSVSISFMNARFMSEGTFNNNRGSWLFSARRGYLDLVLRLMNEEALSPKYYDILGKVEYHLSQHHTLSAHFLHAGDRLDFIEDDKDEDYTSYGNTYGWLTLKSFLNSRLFVQSLASYGKLTHDRNGIGYTGDLENIDFTVADKMNVSMFGLKQVWNVELSDRWYLRWGFEFKNFTAYYDYLNTRREVFWADPDNFFVWYDTTRVYLDPSGNRFGSYLSNRFRLFSPLTAEFGLRYDCTSYTDDQLLSPRFNVVCALGKQTFLRGGWGYFFQSQGIHEIDVADGEDRFYPAELAEHWVAGFEHTFRNGFNIRLEGYYKKMSEIRPEYRNWSNSIEIFPEVYDRLKLNFRGATSKGIEIYFKYDRGGKFTCWTSYALAYANEDIRSLVYRGIEYPERSGLYPGRNDQRHTLYLDLNYRPGRNWHFNVSWQAHSGWPYTPLVMKSRTLPDGSTGYYSTYDDFYGANYLAYHRLDLRINRYFYTSHGRIAAFVSIVNLYNRNNVRNIDYNWAWSYIRNRPYLEEEHEHWFKLLPSIGVTWSWGR